MREIFEALEERDIKRPDLKQHPIWYPLKIGREEAWELLEVTQENPTPEQQIPMLKEGADIIQAVAELWRISGISSEVALQAVLDKIREVGERPSESFTGRIRGVPNMLDYEGGVDTELVLFTNEN